MTDRCVDRLQDDMRISAAALDLVASVELHAHKPPEVVRAELGSDELDVAAEIQRLERCGIVHKVPFIDPFRLGLNCYAVGFRVIDERAAEKYVPLVVRAEQVSWLRRQAIRGDYSMGIAAPSLAHVIDLFDDLLIGLRQVVARRYFMVIESFSFFGHKKLSSAAIERVPLVAMVTHETVQLDEFDRRLLSAVWPRRHVDQGLIARELRASEAEVAAGIERLRRADVVKGFMYRFRPEAVERRTYSVLVRRRSVDLRLKRRFVRFAEEHPLVSGLINFIGEWDHELTVDAASTEDLQSFLRDVRVEFGREIERWRWSEDVEDLKVSNVGP